MGLSTVQTQAAGRDGRKLGVFASPWTAPPLPCIRLVLTAAFKTVHLRRSPSVSTPEHSFQKTKPRHHGRLPRYWPKCREVSPGLTLSFPCVPGDTELLQSLSDGGPLAVCGTQEACPVPVGRRWRVQGRQESEFSPFSSPKPHRPCLYIALHSVLWEHKEVVAPAFWKLPSCKLRQT
jgi:hypothetical protein